jgi:thioesterase domain-containing protein
LLGGHCAGGIIALEMAQKLRGAGREIALLVVIDAIPENSSAALRRWNPLYFLEMLRNVPGWIEHERRREDWSPRPLPSRTAHNLRLLGRFLVGVRRGKKLDGGNVPEEFMDLSRFPAEQRAFIHRLWGALFTYMPRPYAGKVVVYEAAVKPLLEYPQTRRRWCALVPDVAVVGINGNHNTMLQAPSIGELVSDLKARLAPGAWEPPGSFARQTMGR